MKYSLVFEDWRNTAGQSVYHTEQGIDLSAGNLHAGSTFTCTVEMDGDDYEMIQRAAGIGVRPVFRLVEK